jgi:co-chaperonin GroES (HSP10)
MKLLFNSVLVKFDSPNDHIKVGGVDIQIDTSFNPMQHTITSGEVIGLPSRLIFNPDDPAKTMLYDTDMELKVGDRIIFDYLAYNEAIKNDPIDGGHVIRYDEVLVALRGDDIIPVNGIVLVEPIDITETEEVKQMSAFLEVPDYVKKQKSETRGVVRYVGTPLRAYAMDTSRTIYESDDLHVGDKVYFDASYAIPLQYDMHRLIDKTLYRMRRKDILGIYE